MNERVRRVTAIVKADVLIRFRRLSTLVVFLVLNLVAYVSVPDPATGNALLVVGDGRRALYNSAAIGMATAMTAAIFIGLVGFYVVSNAIGRDISTRCGFVIASTTMRGGEYLLAKCLGNLVFLGTFTAGFMFSSMGMLIVRNETALEPWLFVRQYVLLVPPAIVLAAVLAIVFESIPFLSGRAGDVLFFFVWLACLSVTGLIVAGVDPGPTRYLDFAGLGFVASQMLPAVQDPNLSIGGPFDPTKPLFVFDGLTLDREWLLPRIGTLLIPLPLLLVAVRVFHRFDPAVLRGGVERGRKGWMARINGAFKPIARLLPALDRSTAVPPTLLAAALIDARMTVTAYPIMLLFAVALAVATVATPASGFAHGVLPIAFAVACIAIADVPCRERRAGTLALVQSMPLLKRGFVSWKLLATTLVAMVFLTVPLARVTVAHPASAVSFGIGVFFVAAACTSLGVATGSPKTFTIVFLIFWYVLTNDDGKSPALDFAGFYGQATPLVMLTYAGIGATCLIVAHVVYAIRLRREN